jgi:hypothetical protein
MSEPAIAPDRLDDYILAVPGVEALYPAGPLLATVVTSVVAALIPSVAAPDPIVVVERSGGLSIAANIGVGPDHAAPDVCRRVHDAIAEHFSRAGDPVIAEITVTVARIG